MIGNTLDRKYKLLHLLGQGGMGVVYEAQHTETLERVAVKIIKADKVAPQGEAASRFRREARAVTGINSPHVVKILDSGVDQATSSLYLAMEYLEGEDLQRALDRIGPLPPDVALRVAGQALLGVAKAHQAGIIHRDIKPANLFLARDGKGSITVKLLDFGIAKIQATGLSAPHTSGLTDTGGFLGSPLYMSPEQVQDSKTVDVRTDIWSLGCTFYAALAGSAPHHRIESVGRLILAICGTPAPPLRERAPWVPQEIADIVHRALEIDQSRRHPSAAAMLEAVRTLAPDGFALRDEMLVGVKAEPRAAIEQAPTSPMVRAPVVVDVGSSQPVHVHGATVPLGSTTSPQETTRRKPARAAKARRLWPAGAVLALAGVAAGVYGLTRPPAPELPSAVSTAQPPSPEISAARAAEPQPSEPIRRTVLSVSPPDTAAAVTASARVPASRSPRAPGPASSPAPAKAALPKALSARPEAPPAPPQQKPEDSLMPPEPPP